MCQFYSEIIVSFNTFLKHQCFVLTNIMHIHVYSKMFTCLTAGMYSYLSVDINRCYDCPNHYI